jgi:ribonuclease HI
MLRKFQIISDGACSKNPGPGGWGLIVVTPDGQVREFGGSEEETTNNRMELFGFYRGLQEVYRFLSTHADPSASGIRVRVVSDSKYVLDGAEHSLPKWLDRDWKTVAGEPVKNRDLWEKILKGQGMLRDLGAEFEYVLVKGHAGSEANERVDQIAVGYSRGETIQLFQGGLQTYSVSLDLSAKFEPVYLSFVSGRLERHSTWDACKRATEGKAGAKYKKVKNRLEEQETLKAWGVSQG